MSAKHTPTDDLRDLRAVLSGGLGLDVNQRVVMAVLILHRNGDTGRCDPSLSRIARSAGIGRRTVMRALNDLEESGHVERRQRPLPETTQYTLHPEGRARVTLGAEGRQGQSDPKIGPESHLDRAKVTPERTNERTTERTDAISNLWAVYVVEMDGGRMKLNAHRKKLLRLLYTEQLEDEDDPQRLFRATLKAVKADDYIMSKRSYQEPDSLFRNESKRERWTNAGRDRLAGAGSDPLLMTAEEIRARESAA